MPPQIAGGVDSVERRRSEHICAAREVAMIQQLRIYEIFENNKAAFHNRFRDHAARIMRTRYGFRIVAMWETRVSDRTEFVYLLEWPDEAAKAAAWSAFMADAEWSEIKHVTHAAHGLMVGEIEDRLLVPTDYSPASNFLRAS
jgi:heme-degrading monooxygenase HmoA